MTQSIPRSSTAPVPGRGSALTLPRDCDVCIIGDDVAGLLMACDLAARGLEVVLFPTPGDVPALGLDAALAPGFRLPAAELLERLGPGDAAEAYRLSVEAVRRGLLLAQKAGVPLGPKGRLAVARPAAAGLLAAEHAAVEVLAPETSVLVGAEDVAALLGVATFAAALGLAPAHRLDAAAFRAVLGAAAAEGEITLMPQVTALAVDVHGLRKYVTAPRLKVRAYQLVFSGGAALRRVAPELVPSLVPTPWVAGRFHLPGAQVAYAGLVEEVGGTGLRWHWDQDRLALAAETATLVRGRGAATRVLRRHGAALAPPMGAAVGQTARGVMLAPTRRGMPLIQEGEKGVWYCATDGQDLAHGLMGADLICRAIADRDDRIRLFSPFGLEPAGTRPPSRWSRMAGYWRRRFKAAFEAQTEPGSAPLSPHGAPEVAAHGHAGRALSLSQRAVRAATALAFPTAQPPSRE
ncbi:FAD-binding oxidoreductase/lyase [Xanthobacter agilis]|uniref:Gamma-glutamylputrescine oxidase n=1 Tax=Xanthobacter agilis TaxID=47492 RepID=A0ABU0LBU3_XANAG|nr:hypothetical protein [Xanthobacter agilis]MDQ0504599.1 gamma-glutamylputrescine oxidase [Xanthobacter agilis]